MANYLDNLEAEVREASRTLIRERYYEFEWALNEIIKQAKHYQVLTESMLNNATGHRTFEENEKETKRAQETNDWYRFSDD